MTAHEHTVRLAMAAVLAALAVASFLWPDCVFGTHGIIARSKRVLSPSQQHRLRTALDARRYAEGVSSRYGRLASLACLVAAALEFVPAVPYVLPYAGVCLAFGVVTYLAYVQFRRAVDRRVAPLERRSVLAALPLASILAMAAALVATLMLAVYPELRLGALVIALATALLAVTAWRIAAAPSLLLGQDPQAEYAIDARLRLTRATGTAVLACGPVLLFGTFAGTTAVAQGVYAAFAQNLATIAFIVAFIAGVLPFTKRLNFA